MIKYCEWFRYNFISYNISKALEVCKLLYAGPKVTIQPYFSWANISYFCSISRCFHNRKVLIIFIHIFSFLCNASLLVTLKDI